MSKELLIGLLIAGGVFLVLHKKAQASQAQASAVNAAGMNLNPAANAPAAATSVATAQIISTIGTDTSNWLNSLFTGTTGP